MNTLALFNIGNFAVGIVDIVFVAIVLIVFLVGLKQGFVGFVLTKFKGIIATVVALLTCKPLAGWLSGYTGSIYTRILNWVNGIDPLFTEALPGGEANAEAIREGLEHFSLPTFLRNAIANALSGTTEPTLGEAVSKYFYQIVLIIVCYIVVWILVRFIIFLFRKMFKKATKKTVVGTADRILGGIFGLAFGAAIVCGLAIVISYVIGFNLLDAVTDFFIADMSLDNDGVQTISKWVYNNNPIIMIINLF